MANLSEGKITRGDGRKPPDEQKIAIKQVRVAGITEFRDASANVKKKATVLLLDNGLTKYLIDGTNVGIFPDLETRRSESIDPLDIINGPLMAGVSQVGRFLNNIEPIVAELLSRLWTR